MIVEGAFDVSMALKRFCFSKLLTVLLVGLVTFQNESTRKWRVDATGGTRAKNRNDLGTNDGVPPEADVTLLGFFQRKVSTQSSSTNESDCNGTSAIEVIAIAEAVDYVLTHRYKLMVTSAARSDWRLRLRYSVVDHCGNTYGSAKAGATVAALTPEGRAALQCPRTNGFALPERTGTLAPVLMGLGPSSSKVADIMSPLWTMIRTPALSGTATSDEFSCRRQDMETSRRQTCLQDHEYFFRIAPSDYFQARAILDLLEEFKLTPIVMLGSTDDTYDSLGWYLVRKEAEARDYCIAFSAVFRQDDVDQREKIIERLENHTDAMVVVLFARANSAKALFQDIVDRYRGSNNSLPRIWIASDDWGNEYDLLTRKDFQQATLKTVLAINLRLPPAFFSPVQKLYNGYIEYISNQTVRSIRERFSNQSCVAWQTLLNCSFCTVNESHVDKLCDDKFRKFIDGDLHQRLRMANVLQWLLVANVTYRALEHVMDNISQSSSNMSIAQLNKCLMTNSGDRMKDALSKLRVPCDSNSSGSRECHLFVCLPEVSPAYSLMTVKSHDNGSLSVVEAGSWLQDFPEAESMEVDCSNDEYNQQQRIANGTWNITASAVDWSYWTGNSRDPPPSPCDKECGSGEIMWRLAQIQCCITCRRCKNNKYSVDNETCRSCKEGQRPNVNQSGCEDIPAQWLSLALKVGLIIMTAVCDLLVIVTAFIIWQQKKTPYVRSMDITLTTIMLFALVGGFTTVFLMVLQPTQAICTGTSILNALWFLITMATILVKTSRLARVVRSVSRPTGRVWSMTTNAQVAYIAGMTTLGMIVKLALTLPSLPEPVRILSGGEVYAACELQTTSVLIVDGYVIVLILLTVGVGFITRKLPDNFNEARLLFLAAFSVTAVWTVLTPLYYFFDTPQRPTLQCFHTLAHMLALWVWLYAPRLYAILLRPQRNQTYRFHRTGARVVTKNTYTADPDQWSIRSHNTSLRSCHPPISRQFSAASLQQQPPGTPVLRSMSKGSGKFRPPARTMSMYSTAKAPPTANGIIGEWPSRSLRFSEEFSIDEHD